MQQSAERQAEICKKLQIFSERLKARRNRLGISQETLAERSGVSPRSIVAWESGKDNIPQGTKLSKLVKALGIDSSWLLGEETGKPAAAEVRMYSMRDESGGCENIPTKQDCRDHLEKFLNTCGDDSGKIAWVNIELKENLPLDKWTRHHHK